LLGLIRRVKAPTWSLQIVNADSLSSWPGLTLLLGGFNDMIEKTSSSRKATRIDWARSGGLQLRESKGIGTTGKKKNFRVGSLVK